MKGDLIEVTTWDGSSALCSIDAAKTAGRTLWQDAIASGQAGKGINFYFRGKLVSQIRNYKELEE